MSAASALRARQPGSGRLARAAAGLRREARRLPAAGWMCAALACGNALCWAVITPAFHVPDEIGHIGYVQHIAERGSVPEAGDRRSYSEEQFWISESLPFSIEARPSWLKSNSRTLFDGLEGGSLGRSADGQALAATNYPPLYYALGTLPYFAGYELNFLDRLFLVRLLSVLLAGITVAFAFLFLRELFPSTPWAWTVGGLALAFQPVFGFISGGVTNDALLYTACTATLYACARIMRHGLTAAAGVGLGAALAVGLVTKPTTLAFVPGALLALAFGLYRRRAGRAALAGAGAAIALPLAVFGAWFYAGAAGAGRSATTTVGGLTTGQVTKVISLREQISYAWQSWFPQVPGLTDLIPHYIPWEVYFKGFVGRFGWAFFAFQTWVYWLAAAFFGAVAVLALAGLWRARAQVRARLPEALVYLTLVAGLVAVVTVAAYRYWATTGVQFEQARYFFPLLGLYAAVIALAARGAGARWGPAVGAFMVVCLMGHSLFSQLLVVAHYYA